MTYKLKCLDDRKGAVIPLFAVLLPVLVILCGFAINIAFMQLTRTELKVATDASARAGGRAWSVTQDVRQAKTYAFTAVTKNTVAGSPMRVRFKNAANEIEFGLAKRTNGRYIFEKKSTAAVRNGTTLANAIRVVGKRDSGSLAGVVPLMIGGVGSTTTFEPVTSSTCVQLDRDVALVLDKSGSMAYAKNDRLVAEVLDELRRRNKITNKQLEKALKGIEDPVVAVWYPKTQNGNIYNRRWDSTITQALQNTPELLGTGVPDPLLDPPQSTRRYNSGFTAEQIANVMNYGIDVDNYNRNKGDAPRFSRWEILGEAVAEFLGVFEKSPQEETVSLVTFSHPNSTSVEQQLLKEEDFGMIKSTLAGIRPYNGTGIGRGLEKGIEGLFGENGNTPANARKYAAKTIVVLTDGRETPSFQPQSADVIKSIAASHPVRVHTVTFTPEADKTPMMQVAKAGGGKHYHANDGAELIAIFREIANNLPTTMIE